MEANGLVRACCLPARRIFRNGHGPDAAGATFTVGLAFTATAGFTFTTTAGFGFTVTIGFAYSVAVTRAHANAGGSETSGSATRAG